jgi:putative FmdB family regulatory protein
MMPTYEYACTQCGEHLEVVQSMSDDPLKVCPACGGTLRKVFSPIGIVFKGSGFYRTDSRKDGKAGRTKDKPADKDKPASKDQPAASGDKPASGTSSGSSGSSSAESA